MAVAARVSASELGRTFAQAVQDEPVVTELWVTTRRDAIHLWLLIDDAGDDEERALYGLLHLLDERFPDADFELHVLNRASYTIDLHDVLPSDAEKIFARAA
jgi:hypothetical protein